MARKHRLVALGTAVLASLGMAAPASAADSASAWDSGRWQFSVVPYVWLPNINGSLDTSVQGRRRLDGLLEDLDLSAKLGPNDYLSNLEFAIMLGGEARKGNWSMFTDLIYIDMGDQKTRVRQITGPRGRSLDTLSRQATTSFSSTLWTLGGAYTVARGRYGNVDLLAGFRYADISSDLTLRIEGSRDLLDLDYKLSLDRTEWDGIVGAKGQVLFPDTQWFIPYYFDVGTGSSNWTWQGLVGLGYRFGWGDVTLALRSLSYDFDDKNADLRLTGPAIGVGFHW